METQRRMGRTLKSRAVEALLGKRMRTVRRLAAEFRRRVTSGAHEVSVFLQLDDPYSYLLSRYLPDLADDYDVTLRLYLTQAVAGAFRPEPSLHAEYAVRDCQLTARELGVPFLDKGGAPVVEHRRGLLAMLAGAADGNDYQALLSAALSAYWRGDVEGVARMLGGYQKPGDAVHAADVGQAKLRSLGHYDTATAYYGGEWYRGIDRLQYLTGRLDELGLRGREAPQSPQSSQLALANLHRVMRLDLPAKVPGSASELPPLEFYFSFRSPYAYLAMQRCFDVADAYGLSLRLRPVMPMVARGLPVPKRKLRYLAFDAKREADRLGIDFGRIADPLGDGVDRCMAVFRYAAEQRRAREFMLAAGQAIWARAVDVATDAGMRQVTERAGLFWPDVLEAMRADDWRAAAEKNRAALAEAGLWGVPGYVFGDVALWGQDRLWLLARQIEDRCHDGGILI